SRSGPRRDSRPPPRSPRAAPRRPRALYLGDGRDGGEAPRGDPRVPVRGARAAPPRGERVEMATVRVPNENRVLTEEAAVRARLREADIRFERWVPAHPVSEDAPAEEVLAAYSAEIDVLKKDGGYVTADVIDVKPETPGLEAMLAKFRREHWHDEDEVRFIIQGRGLFHIRPRQGPVVAIEGGPRGPPARPRGGRDRCRLRAVP